MKPSVFKQLDAVAIETQRLKASPRFWNAGLFRYRDRLWLCYRFHLKEHSGRCALAVVELDEKTHQPIGRSQWLKFSGPTGTEHHEDGRLFVFNGQPHVSYTEVHNYIVNVSYNCVMKYARLKLVGRNWCIDEIFHPQWGRNGGLSKEKNWIFFEYQKRLHVIYESVPRHVVLELDGQRVVRTYEAPGPAWHFGEMRGGTPPVLMADGTMLAIFHSRLPGLSSPNWYRYYGAAYTFQAEPPFAPLRISTRPLMTGSEEDGHGVDQRKLKANVDLWKPYVVFPCGLVTNGTGWLCSLGVNDWQCAVAHLKPDQLFLGAANGSDIQPRYFRRSNGSLPVKMLDDNQRFKFLQWEIPRARQTGVGTGYMKCANPREAQLIAELPEVEEINFAEFEHAFLAVAGTRPELRRITDK